MDNEKKKYTKKEKQLSNIIQTLQSSIDEHQLRLIEDSKKLGASKATIENLNGLLERQSEEKTEQKKRMHAIYLLYCKERDALNAALKQLRRYEQNDKEKPEETISPSTLKKNDEIEIEKIKNDLEFIEDYKAKMETLENEKQDLANKLKENTENFETEISKLNKELEKNKEKVKELSQSLETSENKSRDVKKMCNNLEIQLEDATTKLTASQKKKENLENDFKELTEEHDKLKTNCRSIGKEKNLLSNQADEATNLLSEKNKYIKQLEQSIHQYEKESISMQLPQTNNEQEKTEEGEANTNNQDQQLPHESEQTSVMDINEENIPAIVQSMLEKDQLKNKAILNLFKIDPHCAQPTYKDVLKCIAAIYFRDKYAQVQKSIFGIWINATIVMQQQENENDIERVTHNSEPQKMLKAYSEPIEENNEEPPLQDTQLEHESNNEQNAEEESKNESSRKESEEAINETDHKKNEEEYKEFPKEDSIDNKNESNSHTSHHSVHEKESSNVENPTNPHEEIVNQQSKNHGLPNANKESNNTSCIEIPDLGELLLSWLLEIFTKCVEIAQAKSTYVMLLENHYHYS